MLVNYSGWTSDVGAFHCVICFDENRTDYAVHFENGNVARQTDKFTYFTSDWNHDGDVYAKFGAWFEITDSNGKFVIGDFYTPEDLIRFAVEARDPKTSHISKVEEVSVPLPPRQNSLTERIAQAENRKLHQDIERNRKMKALGIRSPGDPWVR